ncbi:oxidoreductase [Leucobacter sp. OLJS4]|uniref:Rossmann-like and DUF2520 domain-containing protein n=1 Tax=unclassified Leucobacter TaxID=2621730 RepID=UPI000C180EF7|nr:MULTISPECIES: DUF2520 domain-containing protein [unclassified Leucobacter]PIJ38715.1 oxidoreductase [Leucobacter sp. OLES1]PII83740.1 oxidoreductase [Leucobacter sp. OLCALW19]PII89273.1 oxidoreductase [Leucobacter sp. OLTLW20]PII90731.1 oxidoreductase [Leucobacter sp. OLAS13]PII96751.1 oxidoreductase [Leucobacter sp. OLCS4]
MSETRRDGRLGIGIVGAGRVGPVLGNALAGAGHAITGISAVSDESRERAEAMLPGVPVLDVPEVVRRSELVLFAIPGDELPGLVRGLTETGAWQPGQLAVHTAPEHGYGVFAPALATGVIPLALHPALVFTGTSLDLTRLAESTIAVTAPAPVLPIGQALAVEMGAEPVVVAERDRPAYAEALAAAREFSSAVVRQALEALDGIGLEQPDRVIGGLVRASVEEALARAVPRVE